MTKEVFTCTRDDSLARAAQLMWEHDCGALPIVDAQRKPIGMITDRDVCMAAYTQGKALSDLSVATAASKAIYSVRFDEPVETAEGLMRAQQVRRLPVVDARGQLQGLCSLNDLARVSERPGIRRTEGLTAASIAHVLATVSEPRPPAVKRPASSPSA